MKKNKLEELIQYYEESIAEGKIPYFDANEYIEIAGYYFQEGEFEKTMSTLSNALHIHPDNEDIQRSKIEYCIDEGELTEARNLINSLTHHSTFIQCLNAELYYEEGDTDTALNILDNLLNTNTDMDIFIDMADLYSDMDEKEKAFRCIQTVYDTEPDHPEVGNLMISILIDQGKYKESINVCNEVIDKNPYNFFAWMKTAETYIGLSKFDKAVEATEFAMIANPENNAPYLLRGQAYMLLENYPKALEDMFRGIETGIIPKQYVYFNIGVCYLNIDEYQKALDNLLIAESLMDESDEFRQDLSFEISKCLIKLKRFKEVKSYMPSNFSDSLQGSLMSAILDGLAGEDINKMVEDITGLLNSEDWDSETNEDSN